jgi:hypothetical protein
MRTPRVTQTPIGPQLQRMSRLLSIVFLATLQLGCIKDLFRNNSRPAKNHTVDTSRKAYEAPSKPGYQVELESKENRGSPRTDPEAPITNAAVSIVESGVLPVGVRYDQRIGFRVADDYPAPNEPHRVLGTYYMVEVDLEKVKDSPQAVEKRHALLSAAALKVGATAMYRVSSQDLGNHSRYFYLAIKPSSAKPVFPAVDALLKKLKLAEEGFKELRRFTVDLETLPERKPEPISFTRGHAYAVAIAFQPDGVDVDASRLAGIDFAVTTKSEPEPRYPLLNRRYFEGGSSGLDGVWERARAGIIADPAYKTETGSFSFTTRFGSNTKTPSKFYAGRGPAEVVIYSRVLSQAEFTKSLCAECRSVAEQCSGRRRLDECRPLRECLAELSASVGTCNKEYEDL